MKKNILQCLTGITLFFAVACQNNDSSKGTRNEEAKAFTGLWMEESMVNPKSEDFRSSYFSAVSIRPDLTYVSHYHYNDDDEQKAAEIEEQVTFKLVLTDHKVVQLKLHEKAIEYARAKGMPEDVLQKAIKAYNDHPSTLSLNEDNSQLLLKSVYSDSKTNELKTSEVKYIRITKEVYQKKATEYLDYVNLKYTEKNRFLNLVSGHNYVLVERVTQLDVNGKIQESSIKADDIKEERSDTYTDGTVRLIVSAKSINFASSPIGEALVNGKYSTRVSFSNSSIKGKFNLYLTIKAEDDKDKPWIDIYGEAVINDPKGLEIVQSNGNFKIIWKYRKVK